MRLHTRRGSLDVDSFELWKDRAKPRPVADVLFPGARICVIGSCFSVQLARHLGRLGYRVWSHPAGELYNPEIIRIELDHVLGHVDWPLDVPVAVDGSYVHRFRKRSSAGSAEELRRHDARDTLATREALAIADVIIVLVGTTAELWRGASDRVATNEIPHPSIFDKREWELDFGGLSESASHVRRIQELLLAHTDAHVALAVCPIPLNATWTTDPVSTANGRTKALLRMAVDAVPGSPRGSYLDLWDWVQTQTGRSTPMTYDGRHISERGATRMASLVAQRLGDVEARPSARHRVRSGITDIRGLGRHVKSQRAASASRQDRDLT
jgi:hypothetical protein